MAISVCKLPALNSLATLKDSRCSPESLASVRSARVGFLSRSCSGGSNSVGGVGVGVGGWNSCVGTSYDSLKRRNCVTTCAASSTPSAAVSKTAAEELDDRVIEVKSVEEFDKAIQDAKRKLVVVEYAASTSKRSRTIYPAMVELSRTSQNAVFLLVMGDASEQTEEICRRAGVDKVPHFSFYKNQQLVHEEEGIDAEQLENDVLYYGDPDAPIYQLRSRVEFEDLLRKHKTDDKLLVIDVGLKNCGPCVKIYPTFIKLSKRMADNAVFARLHGDESKDCQELLKVMGVVEVPTFLFLKGGKLLGRYVGSGRGSLIGEILRHQGVAVT